MKKIKLIILFSLLSITSYTQCLFDVVLVADYSYSMDGYEGYMNEALQAFGNRFYSEHDNIRIGMVLFNTQETIQYSIGDNNEDMMDYLMSHKKRAEGTTNMTFALMLAENLLITAKRNNDVNQMIILITDGLPDEEQLAMETAESIKGRNINICAIKAGDDPEDDYIEKLSSECFFGSTYEDLAETLEDLSLRCR